MQRLISVTEFARSMAEFINTIVYKRESFMLVRGKKAVAELRPVNKRVTISMFDQLLQNAPKLSEEEQLSFLQDLDTLRSEVSKDHGTNRWPS